MTIFGQSKLGRIGYVLMLLAMFAFDFAKDPIQRLIMAEHDAAARELTAPRPADNPPAAGNAQLRGQLGHQSGHMNMPTMLPAQEEAVRQIMASGRKPTPEEMNRTEAAIRKDAVRMALGAAPGNASSDTAELVARRSLFETLYLLAAVAMTAITIVGLLYMVSSRLRDIGWPQYLIGALLAPIFLPKIIGLPLAPVAIQGIGFFFYGLLLVLAFVPGADAGSSGGDGPVAPESAVRTTISSATVKRRPGQFGRLGTQ